MSALMLASIRASAEDETPAFAGKQNFVGIGVELKLEHGALIVMAVLPFSPAQRARLQAGDRITALDGQAVAKLDMDEATKTLGGKAGSYLTLTVVSSGRLPRQLRIRREPIAAQRPPDSDDDPVIVAAKGHLRLLEQREMEKAFNARINKNVDRLRGPLAMEARFMALVGRLSREQVQQLQENGERAILDAVSPERSGRAGRRVRRGVVEANGMIEVRDELNESPRSIVRSELAAVLKSISAEASASFEAERERLERRRREADVLVQIAAFDEALLLTGEQRQKLSDLLSARWTDVWRGHATDRAAIDPYSFCQSAVGAMDLFTIPDIELQTVLRASQLATFKLVQLPTREVSVFIQNGPPLVRRFVRHGLPVEEERLRLKLLLDRLVDDAAAHGPLDEQQKQKLLAAGKLDVQAHFNEIAALEEKQPEARLVVVPLKQIAGVKASLPPIFAAADSAFQRVLNKRLSAERRERIAQAGRERGRFHRQAVLHLLTVALAERAFLTDDQAGRLQKLLGDEFASAGRADDLAEWRRATLKKLVELRPEAVETVLDDWQRPVAREYLGELADTALLEIPSTP